MIDWRDVATKSPTRDSPDCQAVDVVASQRHFDCLDALIATTYRGTDMNEKAGNQGKVNQERIDVNQARELDAWAKKFDTTPEQIKEAVQAVGDQAGKVEMHLKGSRSTTNADRVAKSEGKPG
jgi:hypothetical protein